MFDTYLQALILILSMALVTWFYSLKKSNVNIVDSLWSLMFLAAALLYLSSSNDMTARSMVVVSLVSLWALRLSIHLLVRNWGDEEDNRYRQIRKNNQPNFEFKSLYIIFGLQGLLAWIISIPLLFALNGAAQFQWLDIAALALWTIGFTFETVADYQLLKFKQDELNRGKILDTGLWRYSRHPNYFGEFCIWWAFYLLALPTGGWWTIYAPMLMSFLLLKVSGVVMMEKDISNRRPQYQQYILSTNAFFPGIPEHYDHVKLKEHKS